MKTGPTTTKYKRYDATFKHSAVEHWMLRVLAAAMKQNRKPTR
jgi:hypothetical protein